MTDSTAEAAPIPPSIDAEREAILDAALPEVAFDGWSGATLAAALRSCGLDAAAGRRAFPRGHVDMALAFHRRGDAELRAALATAPLSEMKIREKVTFGVRTRLEIAAPHREAVRRGATLFALPIHAADGARAVWETADVIWTGIGDSSRDYNWWTKRMILSGVCGSTTLFWLGDQSDGYEATWAFLDRRIDNVMSFEKTKAQVRGTAPGAAAFRLVDRALSFARAPDAAPRAPGYGLPGRRV